MTGKLADTVMAVRNGEQLARKYQPVVYNPSTSAQVAQRAKMKLMSQLSAVMAPVIAIPKNGSVSSRNLFTKKNFRLATFSEDTASATLGGIQLTNSVVSFPSIFASRAAQSISVNLRITEAAGDIVYDRVVYCMFAKQSDNSLRYIASRVVSDPGDNGVYSAELPLVSDEVIIYAYGVRDNTEAARTYFGNLETVTAETVAKLTVNRTLTETDITLTETRSYTLVAANA